MGRFIRENRGLIVDLAAMAIVTLFWIRQEWSADKAGWYIGAVILARTKGRGLTLRDRGASSSGDSEAPPPAPPASSPDEPHDGEVSGIATPFLALKDIIAHVTQPRPRPPGGGSSLRPRSPMPSHAGS